MVRRKKARKKRLYTPSQERSKRTFEDIIQAAARILVKDGILAFSTNRVAEVSGVGVGSIYQYFRNKEEILEAIAQRHIDEIRDVLRARDAEEPRSTDALDRLIDGVMEAHLREPALHRAISEIPAAPSHYPRIAREKRKFDLEVDQFLRNKIAAVSGTKDRRKIASAALIIYSLVEGAIHRAIIDARGEYDRAVLTAELKRAVTLYLGSLSRVTAN